MRCHATRLHCIESIVLDSHVETIESLFLFWSKVGCEVMAQDDMGRVTAGGSLCVVLLNDIISVMVETGSQLEGCGIFAFLVVSAHEGGELRVTSECGLKGIGRVE